LVVCGDLELEIETLIDLGNGEWQVNAKLPGELAVGRHPVRVRLSTSDLVLRGGLRGCESHCIPPRPPRGWLDAFEACARVAELFGLDAKAIQQRKI